MKEVDKISSEIPKRRFDEEDFEGKDGVRERKSSPKRDQARPSRRTLPRKRPLSPSRSRRDHKQKRRSPSRTPQRRRESPRRRPRSPYRQRRRVSPKRHVSRKVEYASKRDQPGSGNPMSLIAKASSSPRRGPKKDARPAQVNRQVEICPVVKCSSRVSRMHAAKHLSGMFDDQLEPTEELMRRISVLKICESRLLGSVSHLSRLVDYVNDLKKVRRGKCQVSMRQTKGMEAIFRVVLFQSSLWSLQIHRHLFCTGGFC